MKTTAAEVAITSTGLKEIAKPRARARNARRSAEWSAGSSAMLKDELKYEI
jgi:hypothetical protein